eukprot:1150148-Rhodomonas_salina.1
MRATIGPSSPAIAEGCQARQARRHGNGHGTRAKRGGQSESQTAVSLRRPRACAFAGQQLAARPRRALTTTETTASQVKA